MIFAVAFWRRHENGMSAAARYGIGISTAIAWIASGRQGQPAAAKQGRHQGSRLEPPTPFRLGAITQHSPKCGGIRG